MLNLIQEKDILHPVMYNCNRRKRMQKEDEHGENPDPVQVKVWRNQKVC